MTKQTLVLCGLVALLAMAGTSNQIRGAKPAPPPPPPSLPVHYQLHWLGTCGGVGSEALDMNELGDVVGLWRDSSGAQRAFVCWAETATAVDLNIGADLPAGWRASYARRINNLGQISGTAVHESGLERVFRYDPNATPHFRLVAMDAPGDVDYRGGGINNFGQVVGAAYYSDGSSEIFLTDADLNIIEQWPNPGGVATALTDAGQILALNSGYRYTPGEGWVYFPNHETRNMNQNGDIVGRLRVPAGKNRTALVAVRYTDILGDTVLCSTDLSHSEDSNLSGDAVVSSGEAYLYYQGTATIQPVLAALTPLIVADTSADLTKWTGTKSTGTPRKWLRGMTERDASGFGEMTGNAFFELVDGVQRSEAFVLTPIP